MEQQQLFKVRDKRNKGWFWLDNEYLNGYGKHLGAIGISIYVDLCRHSDNNQKCFPSEKTIANELNLTDRTVRKYIKLFEKYHLVEITKERSRGGKWLNNTYWLMDKDEWIKPEEMISDGKPEENKDITRGNKTQNHRKLFPLKKTHKKNTNKKKEFSSFNKKKPYYDRQHMWQDNYGKWWVIRGKNDFLEFAGLEEDITWK